MSKMYRKKPVVIEAVEHRGLNNKIDVLKFLGDEHAYSHFDHCYHIETLEGTMKARQGDYIIKGVNGEFYPCKPDIFHKTYECVDEFES